MDQELKDILLKKIRLSCSPVTIIQFGLGTRSLMGNNVFLIGPNAYLSWYEGTIAPKGVNKIPRG